jgi:hypothetical protein
MTLYAILPSITKRVSKTNHALLFSELCTWFSQAHLAPLLPPYQHGASHEIYQQPIDVSVQAFSLTTLTSSVSQQPEDTPVCQWWSYLIGSATCLSVCNYQYLLLRSMLCEWTVLKLQLINNNNNNTPAITPYFNLNSAENILNMWNRSMLSWIVLLNIVFHCFCLLCILSWSCCGMFSVISPLHTDIP